ncbi:MAG: hypothetical protein ACI9XR_000571 [Flavobacterium sp.]|jgi:hypothetical protein
MKHYFLLLFSISVFSQVSNYSDLSRFTIGFHSTKFDKGYSILDNPNYPGEIKTFRANSVFVDYRFLQFKNSAFKFGLFLNNYKKQLDSKGQIFNTYSNQYELTETYTEGSEAFIDKTPKLELYLDYNYLLKLKNNFYLQIGTGFSYEFSHPLDFVEDFGYFVNDFENADGGQQYLYGIYVEEKTKWRFHFAPSLALKTDYGMLNAGIKYSLPLRKEEALQGNFTYFDPGPNGENNVYRGLVRQSGKYLSFTLSFTPSKNIFKKKK